MSEKRFINDVDNGKLYDTKGEMYTIYYDDRVDFYSLWEFLNKLNDENEQLKRQNKHLSNIIECIERGSCRSIDSFLDSYCTDELLNEYGLNEDDLFYGDVE